MQEDEELIKGGEEKFMYAYWHTYEGPRVIAGACVSAIAFEVRRKETCISAPMLYSAEPLLNEL